MLTLATGMQRRWGERWERSWPERVSWVMLEPGSWASSWTNHSSASSHGPITAHLVQLGPRQLRVVQVEVLGAGDGRHQRGRAHLAV